MTYLTSSQMKVKLMRQDPTFDGLWQMHRKEIRKTLISLGANLYEMWLPESHLLPRIIQPDEHMTGVLFGRFYQLGLPSQNKNAGAKVDRNRGVLVVTDQRLVFVDKKPFFTRFDEIPLDRVSGISFSKVGFAGTVTLHTRNGDFVARTYNPRCAEIFVAAVEAVCLGQDELTP